MKNKEFDESYMKWKKWGDPLSQDHFGHIATYQPDCYKKILHIAGATKSSRILEIGFGDGVFLNCCRNQTLSIVSIEINEQLVQSGLENNYDVYTGDHLQEFEASSFDFIFAFYVIEHIDPDETVNFLRDCNRALNKDGVVVFRFPNGDSPFSLPNFNADVTHLNWIGKNELDYQSQLTCFKSCETRGTPELIITINILESLYHCFVVPIRHVLNCVTVSLFYPVRNFNMLALDLIGILRK